MGARCVDLAGFLPPDHAARVEEQDGTGRDDIVPFDNYGFQALNSNSITSVLLTLEFTMFDEPSKQS